MKMSSKGIALLKSFEGCRLQAYRDSVGIWTIGYGHTAWAGDPIPKSGMKISQSFADQTLIKDLAQYETGVLKALTKAPNQNQFDAMVSLCFNIGVRAFSKSSVVRYFNSGQTGKAASAFLLWNKAGGKVLKGLTNRRSAEAALFVSSSKPTVELGEDSRPIIPRKTDLPTVDGPKGLLAAFIAVLTAILKRKV